MAFENLDIPRALSLLRIGQVLALLVVSLLATACSEGGEETSLETSPTGSAMQNEISHLEDLPPEITNVVALDAIAAILPLAQLEVVDYFLEERAIAPEQAALLERHKQHLLEAASDDASSPVVAPERLENLGITLVDPRPVTMRLSREREVVEAQVCQGIELVDGGPTAERHNLIVYYVRNVLRLCGGTVDWQPTSGNAAIEDFFALFADGNYYKNLDAYLEDFRNEPFMRRHNLFVATYFQYLRLAFEARSIDFPRREFVDRRLDLYGTYPELRYLSEYFAVLVRAGVIN